MDRNKMDDDGSTCADIDAVRAARVARYFELGDDFYIFPSTTENAPKTGSIASPGSDGA